MTVTWRVLPSRTVSRADPVPGLATDDRVPELRRGVDAPAVDGDDRVAAERRGDPIDRDLTRRRLDACVRCRALARHAGDDDAMGRQAAHRLAQAGSIVWTSTPSHPCSAWPLAISCDATDRAVLLGDREADAALASTVPPWICKLTPITRPWSSSRGPPELPWLIGASVWIAPGIVRRLGAWMSRPVALTMPGGHRAVEPERVPDRIDGISDRRRRRVVERERVQHRRGRADAHDGQVGRRVGADDLGGIGAPAAEADADALRSCDDMVVGDDVSAPSITKPEPSDCTLCVADGLNGVAGPSRSGSP